MKFDINNRKWDIQEIASETLQKMYKEETERDINFMYGLCKYSKQTIYLNKDICDEQKIKTLKHELCHCYIWEFGLYNATEKVDEEVICDIVASSNDFINEIVNKYIGITEETILYADKLPIGKVINEYKSKH